MHRSLYRETVFCRASEVLRILCLSIGKKENEFQNSTFLEWDFGAEKINGKGLQQLTTGTTNTAPLYTSQNASVGHSICTIIKVHYSSEWYSPIDNALQCRMVQSYRQCFTVQNGTVLSTMLYSAEWYSPIDNALMS